MARNWIRVQDMKLCKNAMLMYAVTDRAWAKNQTLYEQVECALKGGVTCVQLREKDMDFDEFLKEATQIGALCKKYNVPFIINDNIEVAIRCKADGIHIGQHDISLKEAREMVGNDMIIGVSAQTAHQALEAQNNGADYLGVGAMFSTSTKLDADDVAYDTLKQICIKTSIPVVAIGGINKDNILELANSGVDGVALVSAIFGAEDIESECKVLKEIAERMVNI